MLIAANQDTVFGRLADAMGEPELADATSGTPRTAPAARNQAELDDHIARWTAKHDADELLALLEARRARPVASTAPQDMLRDPHFAARDAHRPRARPAVRRARHAERRPHALRDARRRSAGPARRSASTPTRCYGDLLGLTGGELDELAAGGHI